MPSSDYQIVFRGRIAPGVNEQSARATMAKLFKTDVASIERLFDGRRQILKKGLPRDAADKYRAALRKAGLIVSVVSEETQRQAQIVEQPQEINASSASAAADETSGRASFAIDDPAASGVVGKAVFAVDDSPQPPAEQLSPNPAEAEASAAIAQESPENAPASGDLAPVGAQLVEHEAQPALVFDLDDIELADAGSIVDNTPAPPRVEMDTGDLSAAEDFAALDDAPPPPPVVMDLEGLNMDTNEGPVDTSPPPMAAQIDVSDLSMADSFEGLDARPADPAPSIDTSHLELDAPPGQEP